jgi:hypothetical protein
MVRGGGKERGYGETATVEERKSLGQELRSRGVRGLSAKAHSNSSATGADSLNEG